VALIYDSEAGVIYQVTVVYIWSYYCIDMATRRWVFNGL
jgi:hypothetical protein